MSKASVIVVGSGAGGSVAAWELARAGHPVLILEKGRNLFPGSGRAERLRSTSPFSNDEVKAGRYFENQDPMLEPRDDADPGGGGGAGCERSFVGDVNDLPTIVGGGTVHWDAKTPRFWRQDFKGRSLYGPIDGANVADWPLTYDELAPFYDEVERTARRAGRHPSDARARTLAAGAAPPPVPDAAEPADVRRQRCSPRAPRRRGYHAYPFPMAVNSRPRDGRPACNSCGFCSGFGCPIHARGGAAISFLHEALSAGAETAHPLLRPSGRGLPATGAARPGVAYIDAPRAAAARARRHRHPRRLGDRDRAAAAAVAPSHTHPRRARQPLRAARTQPDVPLLHPRHRRSSPTTSHAWRGPSTTFTIDDFVGPETGRRRARRRPAVPEGRDLRGRRRGDAARGGAALHRAARTASGSSSSR